MIFYGLPKLQFQMLSVLLIHLQNMWKLVKPKVVHVQPKCQKYAEILFCRKKMQIKLKIWISSIEKKYANKMNKNNRNSFWILQFYILYRFFIIVFFLALFN